jgi:cystathionine beta-synthase
LFDDTWMRDQGLISGDSYGDLRDLISQRVIISVGPDDTLTTAYTRMRAHGVSQLPVIESGELRGIIDEWDLLHAVNRDGASFSSRVRGIMTTALDTIESSQDISTLVTLFERDLVPIIMHEGRFVGVVTKIDYLNYLRKQFVAQTIR